MHLPVAVGMQAHPVGCPLAASIRPPKAVMVVPSRACGALLMAHRTETVGLCPPGSPLPSARAGVGHLHAEACRAGHFPWRVVRVRHPLARPVPFARPVPGTTAGKVVRVSPFPRPCPPAGPFAAVAGAHIFCRTPSAGLLWRPPRRPGPQRLEEGGVHGEAGRCAPPVAVRVGPPRMTAGRWARRFPAVAGWWACTMCRLFRRKVGPCFRAGWMISWPASVRTDCPRTSTPSSLGVMRVFSGERASPRSRRNGATRGVTSGAQRAEERPVMMQSAADGPPSPARVGRGGWSREHMPSSAFRAREAPAWRSRGSPVPPGAPLLGVDFFISHCIPRDSDGK
jgi:hypothetical protein